MINAPLTRYCIADQGTNRPRFHEKVELPEELADVPVSIRAATAKVREKSRPVSLRVDLFAGLEVFQDA
jgi:hypothetical protein